MRPQSQARSAAFHYFEVHPRSRRAAAAPRPLVLYYPQAAGRGSPRSPTRADPARGGDPRIPITILSAAIDDPRPVYDGWLVVLSLLIALLAAGACLDLAGPAASAHGRARTLWLTGAALALGLGIWAMHVVAMLAYRLPLPVTYDAVVVALALGVALGGSGAGLALAARRPVRQARSSPPPRPWAAPSSACTSRGWPACAPPPCPCWIRCPSPSACRARPSSWRSTCAPRAPGPGARASSAPRPSSPPRSPGGRWIVEIRTAHAKSIVILRTENRLRSRYDRGVPGEIAGQEPIHACSGKARSRRADGHGRVVAPHPSLPRGLRGYSQTEERGPVALRGADDGALLVLVRPCVVSHASAHPGNRGRCRCPSPP